MSEEKTIKFPAYLYCPIGPRSFTVSGMIDANTTFSNGRGYVYDGLVWIFCKNKPKDSMYPYFWYEKGTEILFGKVREEVRKIFDVSNLKDWSYLNIVKQTDSSDKLYDEEMITKMNSSTKIYKPTIKEEDDILKKLIKTVILMKDVNVKRYSTLFPKAYVLPNLITGLDGKTKTSINVWELWMSMLGTRFDIIVHDEKSSQDNPLPNLIHYSNTTGKITAVPVDSELYDEIKETLDKLDNFE